VVTIIDRIIQIPLDDIKIEGKLDVPKNASGLVLFAHGSGSSRHSPRNNYVAQVLHNIGIGTLLMDLLSPEEDLDYQTRFNIPLLTQRLIAVTHWVKAEGLTKDLPIGYFGASTGAAAALQAAAALGKDISAVVSRGGRPDMAGKSNLALVKAPTLLLVGGLDEMVLELNRTAYDMIYSKKEFAVIPGATHLFEEPGTLEEAAYKAGAWFIQHLKLSQLAT
jgi:putative phosphoribosyl transferase